MAHSDQVNLYVTDNYVSNVGTGAINTARKYVNNVLPEFEVNDGGIVSVGVSPDLTLQTIKDWWANQPETDQDKNLLLCYKLDWGEGGLSSIGGFAGVTSIASNFPDLPDPDDDPDLIGGSPVTGYAAPMQMSTILHEIAHLYGLETGQSGHSTGYSNYDTHKIISFVTPCITGYAEQEYDQACLWGNSYYSFTETRYVQGYTECADSEDPSGPQFPKSVRTFSRQEINNL